MLSLLLLDPDAAIHGLQRLAERTIAAGQRMFGEKLSDVIRSRASQKLLAAIAINSSVRRRRA